MSWPSLPGINLKVPIGLGVAETSFTSNAIIRKPVSDESKFNIIWMKRISYYAVAFEKISGCETSKFQMHGVVHVCCHLYIIVNSVISFFNLFFRMDFQTLNIYPGRNFSFEGWCSVLDVVPVPRCHRFAGSNRSTRRCSMNLIDWCQNQDP